MHNPSLWLLIKINLGGFIKREKGSKGAHLSESSHEEGLPGTHCATPITALPSFSTSTHSYSNHCATQHSQTLPTTLQSEPLQTLHDPNPDLCFSLDDYCDFGPNFFYPNAESTEEQLEPLFDYHRFQPFDVVCLDDDCSDSSPAFSPRRKKLLYTAVEKVDKNEKFIKVLIMKIRKRMIQVYPEGTHLMIPWFERPIVDDVRACPNLVESSSGSHDLQMDATLTYKAEASALIQGRRARVAATSSVLKNTNVRLKDTVNQEISILGRGGSGGLSINGIATYQPFNGMPELKEVDPQCSGTFQDIANSAARQKEIMVLLKIYWGDASGKICEAIDNIPLSCLVIGNRGVGKLKS
ncbi:unnamed protein product [Camellia sinensis]